MAGSNRLRGLKSVAQYAEATGKASPPGNDTIAVPPVVALGKPRGSRVREGFGDEAAV